MTVRTTLYQVMEHFSTRAREGKLSAESTVDQAVLEALYAAATPEKRAQVNAWLEDHLRKLAKQVKNQPVRRSRQGL